MISLLQSIVSAITSIFSIIINAIKALVMIIGHIPTYLSYLVMSISLLPTIVIPFITVTLTLWVIYFLLDREH